MMLICTILSAIIILSYVLFNWLKYGKTDCFSRTYYNLKHPFVFTGVLLLSSILLLPPILENTSELIQYLPFLGLGGFMFVALSPKFLEDFEGGIHKTGAFVGFVATQTWAFIQCPIILSLWIPCLIASLLDKKCWLYYAEIATWLTMVMGTLYLIICQ